jgi:hypothetical protein
MAKITSKITMNDLFIGFLLGFKKTLYRVSIGLKRLLKKSNMPTYLDPP